MFSHVLSMHPVKSDCTVHVFKNVLQRSWEVLESGALVQVLFLQDEAVVSQKQTVPLISVRQAALAVIAAQVVLVTHPPFNLVMQ
jgi:hypothetical protein